MVLAASGRAKPLAAFCIVRNVSGWLTMRSISDTNTPEVRLRCSITTAAAVARIGKGVDSLIVRNGLGYRDEYRGDAPRSRLKYIACARARDDECRSAGRHAGGNIVKILKRFVALRNERVG